MTELQESERSYHACLIFERDDEHPRAIADDVVAGLDNGERALCLVHELDTVTLADTLEQRGVDVGKETADGALQVVRARQAYLPEGVFDPAAMIESIALQLHQARLAGYCGLCAAGEMSWALEGAPGSDRLVEYEALLNLTAVRSPLLGGLCTYDGRRFPADVLQAIRRAHPINIATLHAPRDLAPVWTARAQVMESAGD